MHRQYDKLMNITLSDFQLMVCYLPRTCSLMALVGWIVPGPRAAMRTGASPPLPADWLGGVVGVSLCIGATPRAAMCDDTPRGLIGSGELSSSVCVRRFRRRWRPCVSCLAGKPHTNTPSVTLGASCMAARASTSSNPGRCNLLSLYTERSLDHTWRSRHSHTDY